jgi:hypothetical protein
VAHGCDPLPAPESSPSIATCSVQSATSERVGAAAPVSAVADKIAVVFVFVGVSFSPEGIKAQAKTADNRGRHTIFLFINDLPLSAAPPGPGTFIDTIAADGAELPGAHGPVL